VAFVVIAGLVLVNAIYVAAEFSAVGVRRSRIRQVAGDGNPVAAWLLPVLESPVALDRYIAACQIGITLSSLVLGAYAQATMAVQLTPIFERLGGLQPVAAESTAAALVLIALTVGQVVFGELVPKSLALQYPTRVALYTVVPMVPSLWIYRPLINWLNGLGTLLLRVLGMPQHSHRHVHSPAEIELLIAESRDGGLLEPDEHRRLQRALRLTLRQAKQLMVPRRRTAAVEVNTPLETVIDLVSRSPYSRLPVYRETIDNIVGVLHTKDVVRWLVNDGSPTTVGSLVRPIASVHESVAADRVLRQFRERRVHMGLVVDDFGGTSGIVTLEDVLAELLGDVGDEFKPRDPTVERLPDRRLRLPGDMAADDAAAILGTKWDGDATTIGGLITATLGHLPVEGERVDLNGCELVVERMSGHAIASVLARLGPAPQEDEASP